MARFAESVPFDYSGYFSRAVQFLSKYRWIYGSNNTRFIREGVLDAFPRAWINDLDTVSNDEFNRIPLGLIKNDWCPSFCDFLNELKQLQVQYDQHDNRPPETRKGIGVKKAYEIANLCSFIESVRSSIDPNLYVDFGSGLGYLSNLLQERCGQNVFGIEGNHELVETCHKRQIDRHPSTASEMVQYCHHFITEESFEFIEHELSTRYDGWPRRVAITGLHSCADLSITAIHCFLRCPWTQSLTIMPCCYHRMETCRKTPSDDSEFRNIPLSRELKAALKDDGGALISRPFLRLGCQQTASRWKERTSEQHMTHGRTMFRRALIDAVLRDGESIRVGKLKQLPEETTVENVLAQYTLQQQVDNERIERIPWTDDHRGRLTILLQRYGEAGPRLAEYLECLQTCLQSICENVILLDRMCYVEQTAEECGIKLRRNLVRLGDDGLSPRCFIFHASKVE